MPGYSAVLLNAANVFLGRSEDVFLPLPPPRARPPPDSRRHRGTSAPRGERDDCPHLVHTAPHMAISSLRCMIDHRQVVTAGANSDDKLIAAADTDATHTLIPVSYDTLSTDFSSIASLLYSVKSATIPPLDRQYLSAVTPVLANNHVPVTAAMTTVSDNQVESNTTNEDDTIMNEGEPAYYLTLVNGEQRDSSTTSMMTKKIRQVSLPTMINTNTLVEISINVKIMNPGEVTIEGQILNSILDLNTKDFHARVKKLFDNQADPINELRKLRRKKKNRGYSKVARLKKKSVSNALRPTLI